MLTLVIALALSQHVDQTSLGRQNPPFSEVERVLRSERVLRAGGRSGPSLAFFEAFPASGAGVGTACSTTAPTGAKGEALTFTRASTATCTKTATGGLATTGIANGDLVTLSSNVARVEYDSNGVLGLLVESSRTNFILRSQQFDDLAWSTENTGVAAPTVTADQAVAPDGTLTADRIQFVATTAAQDNIKYQGGTCGATCAGSVYVKGVSGGGTIDVCSSISNCSPCTYVSTSWTRCLSQGGAGIWAVGNASIYTTVARAANDVYVWGGSAEAGAYATSYIPTTSATVTRSAETATFPVALSTGADFSVAVSGTSAGFDSAACAGVSIWSASPGPYLSSCFGNVGYGGVQATGVTGVNFGAGLIAGWRGGIEWTRATNTSRVNVNGTLGGASVNAGVLSAAFGAFTLGPVGIHSRLCLDPSPTRCR